VGGTSGIGLAAARLFIQEGARVVVAGRAPGAGSPALEEPALLGTVWEYSLELSEGEPEIVRLFGFARDALDGRLDILLHAAGISGRKFGDGPLHQCTNEGWDRVMHINAFGAFLTNREAVKLMLGQSLDAAGLRGTVVNVGSVLDRSPAPEHFGTLAYAASKGAIRALTMTSAAQYAPERIRFNLLVPGLIDTPMAARAVNDDRIRTYLASKQPLTGGPGTADDVAAAALYLCEPSSRFVTGAELVVDGGWCVSEGVRAGEPPTELRCSQEGEPPREPLCSQASEAKPMPAQRELRPPRQTSTP
jgi:NAD(P)-dependent dehydrogenase (short-subunit alcohol dehydrogenase family)